MKKTAISLMDDDTGEGAWVVWPGGHGEFRVHAGTWGGGTVTLEQKGPTGEEQTMDASCVLSADGGAIFVCGPCEIRAVAATATGVSALAVPVPLQ
jgi:hypothetical protein